MDRRGDRMGGPMESGAQLAPRFGTPEFLARFTEAMKRMPMPMLELRDSRERIKRENDVLMEEE